MPNARRQTEEQHRSLAAELRAVLESMNDAVYIGTAQGITLANQPAQRVADAGFDAHLTKPAEVESLAQLLARLPSKR
jgi:PAS domain-containing protein